MQPSTVAKKLIEAFCVEFIEKYERRFPALLAGGRVRDTRLFVRDSRLPELLPRRNVFLEIP
jgi:hypothetical protein